MGRIKSTPVESDRHIVGGPQYPAHGDLPPHAMKMGMDPHALMNNHGDPSPH